MKRSSWAARIGISAEGGAFPCGARKSARLDGPTGVRAGNLNHTALVAQVHLANFRQRLQYLDGTISAPPRQHGTVSFPGQPNVCVISSDLPVERLATIRHEHGDGVMSVAEVAYPLVPRRHSFALASYAAAWRRGPQYAAPELRLRWLPAHFLPASASSAEHSRRILHSHPSPDAGDDLNARWDRRAVNAGFCDLH